MSTAKVEEFPVTWPLKRRPSHPGAVLADILLDLPHAKAELARLLGISRQHFYDIIGERKPVTPQIAAKLGRMFGGGAELWLRHQAAHDAWLADQDETLKDIPVLPRT